MYPPLYAVNPCSSLCEITYFFLLLTVFFSPFFFPLYSALFALSCVLFAFPSPFLSPHYVTVVFPSLPSVLPRPHSLFSLFSLLFLPFPLPSVLSLLEDILFPFCAVYTLTASYSLTLPSVLSPLYCILFPLYSPFFTISSPLPVLSILSTVSLSLIPLIHTLSLHPAPPPYFALLLFVAP